MNDVEIVCVHLLLAAALFLCLNWLGRHSLASGYLGLSAFVRVDEAPAFNIIFRVIGPIVFVTLAATLLYWLGFDRYVVGIWHVTAYYCLARVAYIVFFDRVRLVNWPREVFVWMAMIGGSWLVYGPIISSRESLLPEVKDLKNQFWILLFLFLFTAFNNVRLGSAGTLARKKAYLSEAYAESRKNYGHLISSRAHDDLVESIVYAVLIYEQFNRPRCVRLVERLVFPFFSRSLGPMQVTTATRITDKESVQQGTERLVQTYHLALSDGSKKAASNGALFDPILDMDHRTYVVYRMASNYNKDDRYLADITEMHREVIALRYPSLLPPPQPHWSEYIFGR